MFYASLYGAVRTNANGEEVILTDEMDVTEEGVMVRVNSHKEYDMPFIRIAKIRIEEEGK
jgi:archaellum component FlaF (FlaF/FlaG flagellin family)